MVEVSDADAGIQAAQRDWFSAVLSNDADRIAALMAPDWVIVTPGGIIPAEPFLAAIRAGVLSHSAMAPWSEPDGIPRVRVHDTAATVTHRVGSTETNDGRTRENDEWMTTVLVRDGDRWLSALIHLTPAG